MNLLLSHLEIGIAALEALFNIIDDGDGLYTAEEFVSGIRRVRRPAKAVDIIAICRSSRKLEGLLGLEVGEAPRATQ